MFTIDNPVARANIVSLLNITSLSAEEQNDVIQELQDRVTERIFEYALDTLSDEDKDTLEDLSEAENIEGVAKFLQEKIPNFNDQVKSIVDFSIIELKRA